MKSARYPSSMCSACVTDRSMFGPVYDRILAVEGLHKWAERKLPTSKRFAIVRSECTGCTEVWCIKYRVLVNLLMKLGVKV